MKPRLIQRIGAIRLLAIGYLILAIATAGAFYSDHRARVERIQQLNAINRAQCSALERLYNLNRQTVAENDLGLDAIDYYKHHPDELAAAHAKNRATLKRYEAPPCPPNVTVST